MCSSSSGRPRVVLRTEVAADRRSCGRGPRARAPSRKRPVIVAVMSSLPSGGVDVSTPTTSPISDSVRRALAMSLADVPVGLAALEQLAQRLGERCARSASGRIAAARRARSTNGSPTSTRARTARAMPSSGATSSIRADASRASRRRTAACASSSSSASPVREVAVDRRPGDPGRRGDVVHARLLALRPRTCCAAPSRIAAATRCCRACLGAGFGHRRLAWSLRVR